jgi:hypothetical protein
MSHHVGVGVCMRVLCHSNDIKDILTIVKYRRDDDVVNLHKCIYLISWPAAAAERCDASAS